MGHWVVVLSVLVVIFVLSQALSKNKKQEYNKENVAQKELKYKLSYYQESSYSKFVAIDLETTGLDATQDKIIEIAAIKIDLKTQEKSEFHKLIKINQRLPKIITKITGITDDMLKNGENQKEVLKSFNTFIGDLPLVAHNAKFDAEFLINALNKEFGLTRIDNLFIDSISQFKLYYPRFDSYKLKDVIERLEIQANPNHRALNDADAVAKIYELTHQKYLKNENEKEKTKEIMDFVSNNRALIDCIYYIVRLDGKLLANERAVTLEFLIKTFGNKSFFDDSFIKSFFSSNKITPSPNDFLKSLKAIENKNSFLEFAEQILTIKKKPSELEISTLELIKKTIQSLEN